MYYKDVPSSERKTNERHRRNEMATDTSVMEQGNETEDNATEQLRALVETNPNERTSVMVTMPASMKLRLVELSEEKDVTLAKFVREMLADAIDFDLPDVVRTRARKYKTEDERKAAQKSRNNERKNLINALLKAYKNNEIDLSSLMDDDDN